MNFLTHIKNKKSLAIIDENKNFIKSDELQKVVKFNSIIISKINIKRTDTLAIVLENGPDFITSFLSVINTCIAAPLNPSYTEGEFNFYFKDLKPKALITNFSKDHPSLNIAKKYKIKIINIEKYRFLIEKKHLNKKVIKPCISNNKDLALILHTSGTTSKPKMVALSHYNLIKSAKNISSALKLTAKDKNIILMPSFHIHGIIASILAPLYKGGKVVALPKFNVLSFYQYLSNHKPTWFTAVPTMLQSIIDRSKNNSKIIKDSNLKFIRSSSASLPVKTLKELEKVFNVPLIESYGMTEATHQMTTNLLPPFKRKPGSVGLAVGLKVKVVDNNFVPLPNEKEGEVIIKGESVFKGYLANNSAN